MRSPGIPKREWEGNIKMDLEDGIGECGLDSSGSGQRPVAASRNKSKISID
jgi:hypothetical protein